MNRHRQLWFWLWLLTGAALAVHLAGGRPGLPLAIGLATVQVVHQVVRTASLRTMSVQVRYLFLVALLVGGASPRLWGLHHLLVAGIIVRLVLDYCVASRVLWLAPWNRNEPLTWGGLRKALRPSGPQA